MRRYIISDGSLGAKGLLQAYEDAVLLEHADAIYWSLPADTLVKEAVLDLFRDLHDPSGIPLLIDGISSTTVDNRCAAADALGKVFGYVHCPPKGRPLELAFAAVMEQLAVETVSGAKSRMMWTLAMFGESAALPILSRAQISLDHYVARQGREGERYLLRRFAGIGRSKEWLVQKTLDDLTRYNATALDSIPIQLRFHFKCLSREAINAAADLILDELLIRCQIRCVSIDNLSEEEIADINVTVPRDPSFWESLHPDGAFVVLKSTTHAGR